MSESKLKKFKPIEAVADFEITNNSDDESLKIGRPLVMPVEDRCREIFNAAEKLFGEKGFSHVTMAEIASTAGMSKKTLYVHFADKRELLKSLVSSSYLWTTQTQNLSDKNSDIESFKQHLKMIAQYVLSDRHLKLFRLAIAESYGSEQMSETFYKLGVANSRQSLIDCIQKIPLENRCVKLSDEILADMIFGAVIGKFMIDALMITSSQHHSDQAIHLKINEVIDGLFIGSSV